MLTPATIWPNPLPAQLPAGACHVWHAPLDLPAGLAAAVGGALDADEEARADRFYFDHHRAHYRVGRGLLRLLLGHYLGLRPEAVALAYSKYGKPYLPAPALQFNLSHAGGRVLFAFAQDRAVGVDIEPVRELADAEPIARRFFAPGEVARFLALPAAERPAGFFNCWTRKEAFIKAVGEGLSHPLDIFEVSLAPGEPARLLAVRGSPAAARAWQLQALAPGGGYVAALVVAGAEAVKIYETSAP